MIFDFIFRTYPYFETITRFQLMSNVECRIGNCCPRHVGYSFYNRLLLWNLDMGWPDINNKGVRNINTQDRFNKKRFPGFY